jgi:hypothetical protein
MSALAARPKLPSIPQPRLASSLANGFCPPCCAMAIGKQVHDDGAKDDDTVPEIVGEQPATSTPAEVKYNSGHETLVVQTSVRGIFV